MKETPRGRCLTPLVPEALTVDDCELVCDLPAKWNGRCYAVAFSIVEANLVDGVVVYGHYHGPISGKGYWADYKHLPFVRHAWIKLADGRILDPTRWSFTNEVPFIYITDGDDSEYSDKWGRYMSDLSSFPDFSEDATPMPLELKPEACQFLQHILPREALSSLTVTQVHWIANLPYEMLGKFAPDVYQAICRASPHALAFIPLDNRRRCEREHGISLMRTA